MKSRIPVALAFLAATALFLGVNFAISHATSDMTDVAAVRERPPAAERDGTQSGTEPSPAMEAGDVCADLAPRALRAYVTDSPDRDGALREMFTADAAGLSIPASRIMSQPLDTFTGFLVSGDGRTATCAVATGLASAWTMTYEYDDGRWLCSAVAGPLDGAYVEEEER